MVSTEPAIVLVLARCVLNTFNDKNMTKNVLPIIKFIYAQDRYRYFFTNVFFSIKIFPVLNGTYLCTYFYCQAALLCSEVQRIDRISAITNIVTKAGNA